MNNLRQILNFVETRNRILSPELKSIQHELESVLERYIMEAGVINPGYFSYFLPVLNNWVDSRVIERYHISEEGYSDGLSGKYIKIPVIDVFVKDNSSRIFILPHSFLNKVLS
jgi:hypothetical protein